MRVLVCGGRNFDDPMTLASWLGGIHRDHGITCIIAGGASGADKMAVEFARWKGIKFEEYPADWSMHGRAAGPIRNRKMLEVGRPDLVVAFRGGKGTDDMMRQAKKAGVKVFRPKTIRASQ